MTSSRLHPEVLWAQRQNEIYVTINLVDIKDPKIDVTKDKISFEGIGGTEQKLYQFELNFHKEINPEASKRSQTARSIIIVLDKAEHGQKYWPRLQKEPGKISFLKTDFARWKDEDEDEDEGGQDPLGGMDFSNLMGSGGAGGGGAGFEDDSDDEDYPELENANDTAKTDEPKEESNKEAAQEEEPSKEAAKD